MNSKLQLKWKWGFSSLRYVYEVGLLQNDCLFRTVLLVCISMVSVSLPYLASSHCSGFILFLAKFDNTFFFFYKIMDSGHLVQRRGGMITGTHDSCVSCENNVLVKNGTG